MTITKDNAKQWLPLVQALIEGKTVQYRHHADRWSDAEWVNPGELDASEYRIKPEPVLRPWRWDEVPKVFVMKRNGYHCVAAKCDDRTGLDMLGYIDGTSKISLHDACHGKWLRVAEDGTEHPCGILESNP